MFERVDSYFGEGIQWAFMEERKYEENGKDDNREKNVILASGQNPIVWEVFHFNLKCTEYIRKHLSLSTKKERKHLSRL